MKKTTEIRDEAQMRDEYDFSGAIRGKHYRAYRAGQSPAPPVAPGLRTGVVPGYDAA